MFTFCRMEQIVCIYLDLNKQKSLKVAQVKDEMDDDEDDSCDGV